MTKLAADLWASAVVAKAANAAARKAKLRPFVGIHTPLKFGSGQNGNDRGGVGPKKSRATNSAGQPRCLPGREKNGGDDAFLAMQAFLAANWLAADGLAGKHKRLHPWRLLAPNHTHKPEDCMAKPQNANQLRWIAEAADGKRADGKCALVWVDKTEKELEVVKLDEVGTRKPLLMVRTGYYGANNGGMRGGADVSLTYNGKPVDLPKDTDAVFLSQSAVEKFVLPYYTRMETPWWIVKKKKELFAKNIVAAAHREPSITEGSKAPKATLLPLKRGRRGALTFVVDAL